MEATKRILLVGNTAWSMYNFRLGVSKAMRAAGYEVIIVAPYDHTSDLIRSEGFQHINIAIDNKGVSPVRDLRLLKDLHSLYLRLRPQLVVHYTIKPNIYGGFAARMAGVKCISFVTGLGSVFVKPTFVTKLVERMYRLAFLSSTKVWFLNQEDHQYFVGRKIIAAERAEVLPGEGIDTEFFCNSVSFNQSMRVQAVFKFLYLGRILKDKGILELIEASRALKEKYPEAEVQLLGYIDALNPSAITQSEVEDWVQKGLVTYLGTSTDVRSVIAGADCVVLPSYREGISRTLLEAASMEKPIIATDVPGCRELVDAGKTGFLCRVKDSKDLSLQMEALINMPAEARHRMGELARLKVLKEFDEKIVINKYLTTLSQIV